MKQASKRHRANKEKVDRSKKYSSVAAMDLLLQLSRTKFDETVDVSMRLGVDPKQSDQQVRSAVVLPHGTGKKMRVLVFAKGEKGKEAEDSGADYVGSNDLIEKIQKGWMEFDKVIATPDMMGLVSKLGKVLGPKGLMPNPKMGTVTFEVGPAVQNEKKGKIEFKVDKAANLHTIIGKVSFGKEKLLENFKALMAEVVRKKPSSSKGIYLRSLALSTCQSPGIRLNPGPFMSGAESE